MIVILMRVSVHERKGTHDRGLSLAVLARVPHTYVGRRTSH